jgi:hypothetical protein
MVATWTRRAENLTDLFVTDVSQPSAPTPPGVRACFFSEKHDAFFLRARPHQNVITILRAFFLRSKPHQNVIKRSPKTITKLAAIDEHRRPKTIKNDQKQSKTIKNDDENRKATRNDQNVIKT